MEKESQPQIDELRKEIEELIPTPDKWVKITTLEKEVKHIFSKFYIRTLMIKNKIKHRKWCGKIFIERESFMKFLKEGK